MNENELKVLMKMLPEYLMFLKANPNSLMARIYGIFTVRMEGVEKVHILLMSNAAQVGKLVEKVFDLKGSEINREVHGPDANSGSGTLKDMNLVKLLREQVLMNFQSKDRKQILE